MIHILPDPVEAQRKAKSMPWAYVASYSSLTVGPTPRKIIWSEILDARFFGPEGELRLFRQGDALNAVWVDDTPRPGQLDATADKTVVLHSAFGRSLTMRQHIVFDEDGQATIYTIRLLSWKGGV